MKITKDKLLQIIKEETLALMEKIPAGKTTGRITKPALDPDVDWDAAIQGLVAQDIDPPPEDAGYPGRYGKGAYERPSFPLPKKEVPEPRPRATKAKQEPSELDRILGPDQDLDPKTLEWVDNLIKKPDGLEQLQAFIKGLR